MLLHFISCYLINFILRYLKIYVLLNHFCVLIFPLTLYFTFDLKERSFEAETDKKKRVSSIFIKKTCCPINYYQNRRYLIKFYQKLRESYQVIVKIGSFLSRFTPQKVFYRLIKKESVKLFKKRVSYQKRECVKLFKKRVSYQVLLKKILSYQVTKKMLSYQALSEKRGFIKSYQKCFLMYRNSK